MSDPTKPALDMAALVARVRAGRQQWLQLDADAADATTGRALCWAMPGWEAQYRMGDGGAAYVRECVGLVVGWRGFTVGDVLPGHEDAATALPYSPEALALVLADNAGWVTRLANVVHKALADRQASQEAARGN
jgi:hypothetical protein